MDEFRRNGEPDDLTIDSSSAYKDLMKSLATQDKVEEPTDTKTDVKLGESSLEDYLIGLLSEEVSQLEGVIYY